MSYAHYGDYYQGSIGFLQVLKTQNLRAANVSTKKPQYKRARKNLGVYSTMKENTKQNHK